MSITDDPPGHGVRLVLDLHDGTDTIEGRVEDESGRIRLFRGWLELTALLEQARPGAARQSSTPQQ